MSRPARTARTARSARAATAEVAALATRVGSLLRSGTPNRRALQHAQDEELAVEITRGTSAAAALAARDGAAWKMFAALWHVAEHSGAPLASACDRIVATLGAVERLEQRKTVLLAGPKLTLILVSALPLAATGFGELMGFRPTRVLLSPLGIPIIVLGAGFLIAGITWTRLMIKKLAERPPDTGLEAELLWVALSGGTAIAPAVKLVVDTLDSFSVEWAQPQALAAGGAVTDLLRRAGHTGEAVNAALLEAARAQREAGFTRLEADAEKLAVRVLAPLAVCILPAFSILGVVPTVIAMFSTVAGA